jgi:hypothetical protein
MLSPEQPTKIRQLRTERGSGRSVHSIRSVKQRTDHTVATEIINSTGIETSTVGVGATMSQRKNKPFKRDV